jgi:predicted kinase
MEKILYIVRGIPGSGKSTFAKTFKTVEHYEADMFFMRGNGYEFDATKLKAAHEWCQDMVFMSMKRNEPTIVVSNTFTQEWEMEPYLEMAKTHEYKVFSIIVENRHGGTNQHEVPEEALTKMRERFEIKL